MKQELRYSAKSIIDMFEHKHDLKHINMKGDGAKSSLINILYFLKLENILKISKAFCESDYSDVLFTIESLNNMEIEEFRNHVKRFQDHIFLRHRNAHRNDELKNINSIDDLAKSKKEHKHNEAYFLKKVQWKLVNKRVSQNLSPVRIFSKMLSIFF